MALEESKEIQTDILIIGAGLTGLMATHILLENGIRPVLVDKGRSVGGRLATRRIGPGRADHGAQFFTVRSPEFQKWVDRWLAAGLVYRWSTGWSDGSLFSGGSDGHPRYAVRGGMNALAKHLARGCDIRVNERITSVTAGSAGWRMESEQGFVYSSRGLLLTPPVPQSLALMAAGPVSLAEADRAALEGIAYAPCLAGLFWLEGPVNLPEPGAVQQPDAAVSWMADNRRKGVSPEATIVTVHAGPDLSRQLWSEPETEALAALYRALQSFLESSTQVIAKQLKRWRYALPTGLHQERYLLAAGLPPLVFAGDAFGGPRVEGAALSGLAAGEVLANCLSAEGG